MPNPRGEVGGGLESEGLIAALRSALDHDFHDSFDGIDWRVAPRAFYDQDTEAATRRLLGCLVVRVFPSRRPGTWSGCWN